MTIPAMVNPRLTHAQMIKMLEAALAKAKDPVHQWDGGNTSFLLLLRVGDMTVKIVIE